MKFTLKSQRNSLVSSILDEAKEEATGYKMLKENWEEDLSPADETVKALRQFVLDYNEKHDDIQATVRIFSHDEGSFHEIRFADDEYGTDVELTFFSANGEPFPLDDVEKLSHVVHEKFGMVEWGDDETINQKMHHGEFVVLFMSGYIEPSVDEDELSVDGPAYNEKRAGDIVDVIDAYQSDTEQGANDEKVYNFCGSLKSFVKRAYNPNFYRKGEVLEIAKRLYGKWQGEIRPICEFDEQTKRQVDRAFNKIIESIKKTGSLDDILGVVGKICDIFETSNHFRRTETADNIWNSASVRTGFTIPPSEEYEMRKEGKSNRAAYRQRKGLPVSKPKIR